MEDIAAVEDTAQADILLYDIDIVDGSVIRELARRSVGNIFITVRLLRNNCHICYVSNINALFQPYCCPSCDHFNKMVQHLRRHLATCKETDEHISPKDVYQLRETLFDKLN